MPPVVGGAGAARGSGWRRIGHDGIYALRRLGGRAYGWEIRYSMWGEHRYEHRYTYRAALAWIRRRKVGQ
jgi:hypothetical protein